jgi:OmpA-OmpF porin, OOP family
MAVSRNLLYVLAVAATALCVPATAQLLGAPPTSPGAVSVDLAHGTWLLSGGRSYLGINPGHTRYNLACQSTALLCDDTERPAQIVLGTMAGRFWGVELGYLNMGRIARGSFESRAEGLNLSLIGRAQMGASVGLFGKLGTTYGRTDTSVLGASGSSIGSGPGFGLSFGGGLSLDFSPRLSATLEWDSNDFRFAGSGRDPVRSTNLGLQFRY